MSEHSSKGTQKWLARLKQPRTHESLITEVYGEATWHGALFEGRIADILNYFELRQNPLKAVFNTDDWSLNQLLKEIAKRKFLSDESFSILDDGRQARNELIHRLIAKRVTGFSTADKEMLLAAIDRLYFRIWRANKMAHEILKQLADAVGFTEERVQDTVRKMKEEAQIEDGNLRHLLGDDFDGQNT
jgi:hypothetical protein